MQTNLASRRQHPEVARSTYLRVKLGNQECDCLLDTGSDVTLIPVSVDKNAEIKQTSHVLIAANGTRIAVLGEVSHSVITALLLQVWCLNTCQKSYWALNGWWKME